MNDNSSLTERLKVVEKIKPESNQACVNMLKDMLELANEGKIVAGACVFETFDKTTITIISDGGSFHLIVAGIESLKYKILKNHNQDVPPFTDCTA